MTPRMQETLDAIAAHIERHGVAPTIRGLANQLGFNSTSGVQRRINELVERGYLVRLPNRRQALAIARRDVDLRAVPTKELRKELARRGDRHD